MKFRLDWPAFLIAICLGLAFVYIAEPRKTTKITHPTPLNAGKINYEDKGGNCFKVKASEIPCDQPGLKWKKQQVQ